MSRRYAYLRYFTKIVPVHLCNICVVCSKDVRGTCSTHVHAVFGERIIYDFLLFINSNY